MDIKIYDNNDTGNRIKVFFAVNDQNIVDSVTVGNSAVPMRKGFQFYVDDYIASQIDKTELALTGGYPSLVVREGEEIEIPTEEQEKQKEIEELERKLKELRGEEDVPNE
ncbi:hypothetical protein [Virgibacillus pantothenticus]|uniref:Uncharacterized protein n=1 Tax=Virgibacillus pantothenticus TaxID=1473 RepID=A0A0L0QKK7_VIRPA|nr:hypothetical protein [Virgibacillus pantothenticus]KNE19034.1 hypothetical protein AFK71_10745 [Virgibacillus pantothenticus]MED3739345.1 hypothetical protein [Virgibacillus pantothenticus]QTY15473.1 hypothetical protein KBP50_16510 [Virgibacillus pantothenticus]SIT17975.1 hypothetical protein SAMN05421787_1372 [Virgibacillus pantothenticus]